MKGNDMVEIENVDNGSCKSQKYLLTYKYARRDWSTGPATSNTTITPKKKPNALHAPMWLKQQSS